MDARRAAAALDRALRAGGVAFITGPSGGGKSTLLRALQARLRLNNTPCVVVRSHGTKHGFRSAKGGGTSERARAVLDTIAGPLAARLGTLARAGLADTRVWSQTVGSLSDGQRSRAELARAMAACERRCENGCRGTRRRGVCHATSKRLASHGSAATAASTVRRHRIAPPATLIADEFCSTLDRTTAWCVAASVARWAREGAGRRVVVAAANDDVLEPLGPDVLVHMGLDGRVMQVVRGNGGGGGVCGNTQNSHAPHDRFTLRTGTLAEAAHLLTSHYRRGRPGPVCAVRVAVDRATGEVAGVLVVSRPTLNGSWRTWLPRRSARERARLVNATLRVISRVVIDPRCRGSGLATRLVRAYLSRPLTERTEALAAMGEACPFFARAGMTAVRVPPTARDRRLLRVLRTAGCAWWRLVAWDNLSVRTRRDGALTRGLRRWANDSRATRALARGPLGAIARAAAGALGGRMVFLHAKQGRPSLEFGTGGAEQSS